MKSLFIRLLLIATGAVAIGACSGPSPEIRIIEDQADVDYDILLTTPEEPLSFTDDVQPVLDKRCVVCHGCYDAPCQLKLNSYAGITRGANPEKVYNGSRIKSAPQTRLFVDAQTTEEWRTKNFHTVLNETEHSGLRDNLEHSTMYQMLRLKQLNPQPQTSMLSADVDTRLDRKQECVKRDEFDKFASKHPHWGMPYGLPNLQQGEYETLVQWLAQGAPGGDLREPAAESALQVEQWEDFLNQDGLKAQLVARYIYEHLVQGHLYFKNGPKDEFFRLIRSSTPPGEAAIEIASARPYSDPGQAFWYRLSLYQPHIVIKDHVPYELSAAKMTRIKQLFFEPEYEVTEPAPYGRELASNPFRVFKDLPARSRYEFMLDDARFYIQGFIKGPVCRGQVALNVIEDQFWVSFVSPLDDTMGTDTAFLESMTDYLELPDNRGDTLKLRAVWTDYWKRQRSYLIAKQNYFAEKNPAGLENPLGRVWNGDQTNPNAALTVFRHMDSASVSFGHIGNYPETAWVIDYPLLERIHYLLVVGFNVYGNIGHQLNTRLYMDFLRMEGENTFLLFLPKEQRRAIRDSWYVGVHANVRDNFDEPTDWLDAPSLLELDPDDPQRDLYDRIKAHMGPVSGGPDSINRCEESCDAGDTNRERANRVMREIVKDNRGSHLRVFPDVSFVRVTTPDDQPDLSYTIILNKGYKNLNSFLENENKRNLDDDTLTILPWLEGSYPNFFYTVDIDDIERFAEQVNSISTRDEYERFVGLYGIRRTNQEFWPIADWFHSAAVVQDEIESGIYDLNRYKNR